MSHDTSRKKEKKSSCINQEKWGYDAATDNCKISMTSSTGPISIMGQGGASASTSCLPHSRTQADGAINICNSAGSLLGISGGKKQRSLLGLTLAGQYSGWKWHTSLPTYLTGLNWLLGLTQNMESESTVLPCVLLEGKPIHLANDNRAIGSQ